MNKDQVKKLIEVTGALAEMSTLFLKTALTSGATFDEALALSQVYIAAIISGPAQTNVAKPVEGDVLIVTFDKSEKDEAILKEIRQKTKDDFLAICADTTDNA